MKKALLSLACAVCAPLAMTATPGVNYRYAPQPGKSTMVTTVDKTGKISYELKSTPETPAQRSAKTRMMAEAKNTYTLTVKAGDDAKVFGIWVIKDHVTNWESMLQNEATFTLPAGKYLIQTVYSTTPCVDIFNVVDLTSDMEINVSTSDADKTASIGLYMPNGEKATFPVLDPETYEETDTPHNCDSFVITASADYKGLYACNHQLMGFGGFASEEYIEQAALATNVTDGTMMWICSYDNSQQYMASFVAKDAATVTDGDVYWNDPSEFRKYDVAFERTPAYATGGGNDGVDANFNIVGPNGIWYGGLGLTSAAPLDVYVNTPVYDPASFNLLMTIGDLDYYDADNWVTQGVTSAPLGRTADGIMLMSENYIGSATPMGNTFYYAPAFEMPLQSGMKMGASAPVAITYSDYISWVDKPYYETSILTHIGYYGENRVIDGNSTTVAVDFNGEPIDFSKYDYDFGLWQEQWGTDGHTPGVLKYTFTDTNSKVEDLAGSNVCELIVREGGDDSFPPTVTRAMFCDAEGVAGLKFATAAEANVKIGGGDFNPGFEEFNNTSCIFYPYTPAEAMVEIAPYGTELFAELPIEKSVGEFFMPGLGMVWNGNTAKSKVSKSPNGWFDARITLTDMAGNIHRQVISPAVYIAELTGETGIDNVMGETVDYRVTDGSIVASDNSEVTVYNLAGMRVENRNLAAGVYIANGPNGSRKVAVK